MNKDCQVIIGNLYLDNGWVWLINNLRKFLKILTLILICNCSITAKNKKFLKELRNTHVLNADPRRIETNSEFYKDENMEFLALDMKDISDQNIKQCFDVSTKFIKNGM